MQAPLEQVRRRALKINASSVTENICAPLIAPTVAGYDGIRDALEGLARVLMSTRAKSKSIGLDLAYDALFLLVEKSDEMEKCWVSIAIGFKQCVTAC